MSGRAAVLANQRSADLFIDAHKLQYEIAKDLARHDERHERFKRQFVRESRKHHQCICDAACAATNSMSAAASSALLFAQHDVSAMGSTAANSDGDASVNDTEQARQVAAQFQQLRAAGGTHIWNGLKSFYTPPNATTGVICDVCCAFRSASLVQDLPAPWQEFASDLEPNKHYYYQPETHKVRWHPPPGTTALSQFVFERTHSVFSVCRCKPSHERRQRLLQQFRDHAQEFAASETEKRNEQLHGAFSSLAMSLVNADATL